MYAWQFILRATVQTVYTKELKLILQGFESISIGWKIYEML